MRTIGQSIPTPECGFSPPERSPEVWAQSGHRHRAKVTADGSADILAPSATQPAGLTPSPHIARARGSNRRRSFSFASSGGLGRPRSARTPFSDLVRFDTAV
jgi:hypothetical protein